MDKNYREKFLRLIGITNDDGLEQIRATRIAIGGLGLGGASFINLVRMGFEDFHLADPDIYERTNIGRQRLAKESTIGFRKDESLIKEAMDINPDLRLKVFPEGVQRSNVDAFLEGVEWVVDVVDVFAMEQKLLLNQVANFKGISLISACSLGFGGSAVAFGKGGPTFAELSGISMQNSSEENFRRFLQFFGPEIPEYLSEQLLRSLNGSSHVPFAVPGVEIAAAIIASHISNAVLGIEEQILAPQGMYFNPLTMRAEKFIADYRVREFPQKNYKKAA